MNKYRIIFIARLRGSLGHFVELIEAPDPDAALLRLYDKYDHVTNIGLLDGTTNELITNHSRHPDG